VYALSYFRPGSLDEPIAFLKWHPEAKPLSGGMTLIPTLMQRLAAPSHLVGADVGVDALEEFVRELVAKADAGRS
jgi:CO/xanthine dehydrogenase FAD-binding subunit